MSNPMPFSSLANSQMKRQIARIMLFSNEPEAFVRAGLWASRGAVERLVWLYKTARNEPYKFDSKGSAELGAVLGYLVSTYIAAQAIHAYSTYKRHGQAEWLPPDRHLPFRPDPFATFKFSRNPDHISPDLPPLFDTEHGPAKLDLALAHDTFPALVEPLDWLSARFGTLPRTVFDQIRGEDFVGNQFTDPETRLQAALSSLALPIPVSEHDLFGRGPGEARLSDVGRWAESFGFNLRAPSTNQYRASFSQDRFGHSWENLTYTERRLVQYDPQYVATRLGVLETESQRGIEGREAEWNRYIYEGQYQQQLLTITADFLLKGLFTPEGAASGLSEAQLLSQFNDLANAATERRITSINSVYRTQGGVYLPERENDTGAAPLAGRTPDKVYENGVMTAYFAALDRAQEDNGVFNAAVFIEGRDQVIELNREFIAQLPAERGAAFRDPEVVIDEFQRSGLTPPLIEDLRDLVANVQAEQEAAGPPRHPSLGRGLSPDERNATYRARVLDVLSQVPGVQPGTVEKLRLGFVVPAEEMDVVKAALRGLFIGPLLELAERYPPT